MRDAKIKRILLVGIALEIPALIGIYFGLAKPLTGSHGDAITGSGMMAMGLISSWIFITLRRSGLIADRFLFYGLVSQLGLCFVLGGLGLIMLQSRRFEIMGLILAGGTILTFLVASVMFVVAVIRWVSGGKSNGGKAGVP